MQEAYRALLSTHVLLGCVALAAFWIALALPKGSARHRRVGRVFVWAMALAVTTALPLCASVFVFEPIEIRPPHPADRLAGDVAAYNAFIRHLFGGIGAAGVAALALLASGVNAIRRGRLVPHVGRILGAGVIGHTAFFISIVPRLLPGVYDNDPTVNPLPWMLPPMIGTALVVLTCRRIARRTGVAPASAELFDAGTISA